MGMYELEDLYQAGMLPWILRGALLPKLVQLELALAYSVSQPVEFTLELCYSVDTFEIVVYDFGEKKCPAAESDLLGF